MAWKVWGQLEAERPRWGVGGLRAGGGGRAEEDRKTREVSVEVPARRGRSLG